MVSGQCLESWINIQTLQFVCQLQLLFFSLCSHFLYGLKMLWKLFRMAFDDAPTGFGSSRDSFASSSLTDSVNKVVTSLRSLIAFWLLLALSPSSASSWSPPSLDLFLSSYWHWHARFPLSPGSGLWSSPKRDGWTRDPLALSVTSLKKW